MVFLVPANTGPSRGSATARTISTGRQIGVQPEMGPASFTAAAHGRAAECHFRFDCGRRFHSDHNTGDLQKGGSSPLGSIRSSRAFIARDDYKYCVRRKLTLTPCVENKIAGMAEFV